MQIHLYFIYYRNTHKVQYYEVDTERIKQLTLVREYHRLNVKTNFKQEAQLFRDSRLYCVGNFEGAEFEDSG